ncbi:unnamed protein product [Enterobius vermicularis]|uniref:ZnMc domain-containing protein n=1 Tax=Enterobius vermicularis TaxID=51028 RepID=A0A0N4UVF5_ENTVE|nr:unnamed protein product [Enterobius vermicularis]
MQKRTFHLTAPNTTDYKCFISNRNSLRKAFELWESASSLRFVEKPDDEKTDVEISFARKVHGDKMPFDGKYGIIAHAFYPTDGHLHFDADEMWTFNSNQGINFYQTAVHEIGHLIGLEHSTDERAVMYPANKPYSAAFTLADDDIRGVRKLYSTFPNINVNINNINKSQNIEQHNETV